ncbi:MAG: magnesium transporter [Candidatus Marinimicrobia bacterium]|nr:magnesium transporter [Candidatus Neomarinimicrobiota bacterium]
MRKEFIGTEGFVLLDTVRRLYRRKAWSALGRVLKKIHPGELSWIFRHLTSKERTAIFELLKEPEQLGEFFGELDESIRLELVEAMTTERMVDVIDNMASDDAADFLDSLEEELRDQVLALMRKEDAAEVEELLQYEGDTAGGIMSPDFLAMDGDLKVSEAVQQVQKLSEEAEMAFYIYVIDKDGNLQGVVSLRQLLMNASDKQLSKIMETDVIAVSMETDQEEVAQIVSRYNIMAVPVVDHDGVILGIVTIDDVVDVIREEATEDFLQMVGAGKDREILLKPVFQNAVTRLPWLLASWVGGVLAMSVISSFQNQLVQVIALAGFIPVIIGMGGNIGTQSSTLTIRGLVTGRVDIHRSWGFIGKQLQVGLLLGGFFGILLGLAAWLFYGNPELGGVVALAICFSMLLSTVLGTMVPIGLRRLDVDPAVATGPFVTTSTDVLGVLIYFLLARAMLPI